MADPKQSIFFFTKTPSTSCTLLSILSLFILALFSLHHLSSHSQNTQNTLHFRDIFLSSATNLTLSAYLRDLTLHPHLAGTQPGLQTANYVQNVFTQLGLDTHVTRYDALLSYPVRAAISVHFSDGSVKTLELTEPGYERSGVVMPYHAYSPSGSAYAKAIFANYGREEDYRALGVLGVNVSGCIVIVRRGEFSRGVVVDKAAEKKAVAVLMYTEGVQVKEGGVERGTVMLNGVGDPTSPGWAGVEDGESLGLDDLEVSRKFPKIPSFPISTQNAYAILGAVDWQKVPYNWRDAQKNKVRRPGPAMVNFTYEGEKKMAKIHNVFAVIKGQEEPDRYVLLGNHRDAWTYGAVDPNSGTAALLDIARRYSLLLRSGWIPSRTVVLCSWDAEEFGMIGSTEWVEQNLLNLGSKAVAYLNVDCAVQGPGLFASATPQLDGLIVKVTNKVKDPDSEDMTVYQKWRATNQGINIMRLSGVDSDFAPFLQHAGVPSVDLYYGKDFPVYHTAYDSFNWVTTFGDPFFQRHVAVAGIWGLLALHLADDPILPFNYLSYANQLQGYVHVLSNLLEENISLHPLNASIKNLASAARDVLEEANKFEEQEIPSHLLLLKRRTLNDRLMLAERGFLDSDGLPGRKWFKHLIYGPHGDFESKLEFFPGIADVVSRPKTTTNSREREAAIQHEIWRVARAIQRAAYALRGGLT